MARSPYAALAHQRGYPMSLIVDEQDVWPPRVLVTVTALTVGDQVAIWRVVAGSRTAVRGGAVTATDTAVLALDAELPFGVPVHYEADVNGSLAYTSTAVTYALPGGKNALTDAVTGLAAEVVVQTWPTRSRRRRATVHTVRDGRNIAVMGATRQFASTSLVLYTESASTGDTLREVLEEATSGIVQLRQGSGAVGMDAYLAVLGWDEERYDPTQGADPRLLWRLDVVETDPWAPALVARGYTYADLKTVYTGLTYANLKADYATYLDLRQAELL